MAGTEGTGGQQGQKTKATGDADSLARRIAEPVVRATARKGLTQWARAAGALFKRLRPTLSVGPDGDVRVSIDLAESAIRTVIQDQAGVAYVFAGSEQHLLEAMFSTRERPLFKLVVPFPLDRLWDDELRPWLEAQFGETNVECEPAATSKGFGDEVLGVTQKIRLQ